VDIKDYPIYYMALQLSEGAAILDSDVDEGEGEKASYFDFDDDDDDYEKEEVKSYEDEDNSDDDDEDDDDDYDISYGDDRELDKRYAGNVDQVFRNDPFTLASVRDSSIVNYKSSERDGNSMSGSRNSMEEGYYDNEPDKLVEEKERRDIDNGRQEKNIGHDSGDSNREDDRLRHKTTSGDDDDLSYGDGGELDKGYTGDIDQVFRNDPFTPASVPDSSVVNHKSSECDGNYMSGSRNSMEEGYPDIKPCKLMEKKEGRAIDNGRKEKKMGHDSDDSNREDGRLKQTPTSGDRTRLERQRIVENYIFGTTSKVHINESANAMKDSLAPSISPPNSPPPITPEIKTAITPPSWSIDEFDENWQKYLISTGSTGSENENTTAKNPTSYDINSGVLLGVNEGDTGKRSLSIMSTPTAPIHQEQVDRLPPPSEISSQPTALPASPLSPLNQPLHVKRSSSLSVAFDNHSGRIIPIQPRTSPEPASRQHIIDSHKSQLKSTESLAKYPTPYNAESLSSSPLGPTVLNRSVSFERPSTSQNKSHESPSQSTMALTNSLEYTTPLTPRSISSEQPVLFAHPSANLVEAEQTARESLRDIEVADTYRIKRLALQVKVNLLKEQTKGLKCAFLIDEVFGIGEEVKQPSQACLSLLRDTIAAELTAASFSRYANVVDMITAENFRMENSTLEALQRDQIMSNPLFSEIYTGHRRGGICQKIASINAPPVNYNSSVDTEGSYEDSTVHVSSRLTRSMILKQELRDVLMNSQTMSPSDRLNRRHNYLRSLLDYKITPLASWSKFLRILRNISSQIINGLYGEEVQASWDSTEPRQWGFGVTTFDALGKQHVGAIGTTMVIGTFKSMMDRGIISISKNIGEIAIMLGVPVAMLPWNTIFASSPEYRDILTRSLSRVAKDTAVPSMFLLNQILSDAVVDKDVTQADQGIPLCSNLSTEADRQEAARRIFRELAIGEKSGKYSIEETRRAALDAISDSRPANAPTVALNDRLLNDTIESVIDDKMPILENVLNAFLTYLDENTVIINMLILKLLRKAKIMNNLYNLKRTIEEEESENGNRDGNVSNEEKYEYPTEKGKISLRSMLKGSKRRRLE